MDNQDLTQGALQYLREGINPQARQDALNVRNQAQAQYQSVLSEQLPDVGPVRRMVSDYLTRYAQQPNRPSASAIAAIGAETARGQDMDTQQLLRRQQAAAMAAKMADENLSDEDRYLAKNLDLLGRQQSAAIRGQGKAPTPEKLAEFQKSAMLRWSRKASELNFPSPEAEMEWIRENAKKDTRDFLSEFAIQPTGPRGTKGEASMVAAPTSDSPVKTEQSAKQFDPFKLNLFFPKDSDVDQDKILKSVQTNQALLRNPNSPEQVKSSAITILKGLQDKYGDTSAFQPTTSSPEPIYSPVVPPEGVSPTPLITPKRRDVGAEKSREKELVTVSEGYGKQYNEVLKGAGNAQNTLYAIDNIESNLQGYNTGKLTPMTTEIAAWLKPLGIEIDKKLSNKEAFQKAVGQLTLGLKNVGGENNMPGSLSDSDRKFLESMAPTLADTPEGNRLAIGYYRKIAQRQIDMARQAEDYFERNGTYKGFRKEWDGYVKNNPLFGNQESTQPKRIRITADMLKGK